MKSNTTTEKRLDTPCYSVCFHSFLKKITINWQTVFSNSVAKKHTDYELFDSKKIFIWNFGGSKKLVSFSSDLSLMIGDQRWQTIFKWLKQLFFFAVPEGKLSNICLIAIEKKYVHNGKLLTMLPVTIDLFQTSIEKKLWAFRKKLSWTSKFFFCNKFYPEFLNRSQNICVGFFFSCHCKIKTEFCFWAIAKFSHFWNCVLLDRTETIQNLSKKGKEDSMF